MSAPKTPPHTGGRALRVLVVDDESGLVDSLTAGFRFQGWEAQSAPTGEVAVAGRTGSFERRYALPSLLWSQGHGGLAPVPADPSAAGDPALTAALPPTAAAVSRNLSSCAMLAPGT